MKSALLRFFLPIFLAGCAIANAQTSKAALAPTFRQPSSQPALFRVWPASQTRGSGESIPRLPPPASTAVLIAKGYLIAPVEDFLDITQDFRRSPEVVLYDGKDWFSGRLVHSRSQRWHGYALIRADVPGTPISLMKKRAVPASLLGMLEGDAAGPGQRITRLTIGKCEYKGRPIPLFSEQDVCAMIGDRVLNGALFLDAAGDVVGVSVARPNPMFIVGLPIEEVRSVIDEYFKSWGKGVKPKPAY